MGGSKGRKGKKPQHSESMKVTFSISAPALCLLASAGDAFIVQQLTFVQSIHELCRNTSWPSSLLHHVASDGQSKILMQRGCHRGQVLTSLHATLKDADVPNDNKPQPPVAFRNESSYVLAGAIDNNTTLRQSPSSPYPLLYPPRAVPDPYGWMRDDSRTNATVLAHLEAENEYCRQMTEHLTSLREELYQEFISYTGETDYTCPTAMGEYWYYEIFEKGLSYPRSCRAPRKLEDLYPPEINADWNESIPLLPGEEVYLDVPSIARNDTYFAIGAIVLSKNQEYVAFSLDETGNEICHFHVRHIASGNEWVLHDNKGKLKGYGAIEWDEVNAGIFYVTLDATQRPYQVYYRRLFESDGSYIEPEKQSDELLFEEQNVLFNIHITKTSGGKYLLVTSTSAESSEVHYIDLQSNDRPFASGLRCIAPRRTNLLYRATHACGYWLLLTNLGNSPNLSLKVCPVGTEDPDGWKDVTLCTTGIAVFDGGDQISLDMVTAFIPPSVTSKDRSEPFAYAVVRGREDGLPRVWILELIEDIDANSLATSKSTRLEFNEDAFDVEIGRNLDPSLPYVVITYDSPVTPMSHIAVPLANPEKLGDRIVLKERKVPGYQKHLYVSEKIKIPSRFGHDIPVSLIYRKDALRAGFGNIPVHLYGYGAYGASIEASFQAIRACPLLNRGVSMR
jgi:oligopeptidase B